MNVRDLIAILDGLPDSMEVLAFAPGDESVGIWDCNFLVDGIVRIDREENWVQLTLSEVELIFRWRRS